MAIVLIGRCRVAVRGALLSRVRFYTSRVLVVEERGTEKVTWQPIATHVDGCQSTSTAQCAFLEKKIDLLRLVVETAVNLKSHLQKTCSRSITQHQSECSIHCSPSSRGPAGPASHATGMGRHGTRGPATAWCPRSTTRTHASPTSITKQAATPQPGSSFTASGRRPRHPFGPSPWSLQDHRSEL